VYFIHADHLDTPRQVIDQNGGRRWRWLAEPFGTTAPETNPDNIGAFVLNLRFPGQYADQESGLFYNYFRVLDVGTGRYTQSDPIGLSGGVNTYQYVDSNPLQFVDPLGLVRHNSGRWIDCGKGCKIRIDSVFNEKTGVVIRHLHWECRGREGECGEFGEESHGGTWDDAPEFIRQCALKNGFRGQSIPGPAQSAGAPGTGASTTASGTEPSGSGGGWSSGSPQVYDPIHERWVPAGSPGSPNVGPLPPTFGGVPFFP
jgi:RHS repeat-associated protein